MKQNTTQRLEDKKTIKTLECTKCSCEYKQKKGENFEGQAHTGCGGEFQ